MTYKRDGLSYERCSWCRTEVVYSNFYRLIPVRVGNELVAVVCNGDCWSKTCKAIEKVFPGCALPDVDAEGIEIKSSVKH